MKNIREIYKLDGFENIKVKTYKISWSELGINPNKLINDFKGVIKYSKKKNGHRLPRKYKKFMKKVTILTKGYGFEEGFSKRIVSQLRKFKK